MSTQGPILPPRKWSTLGRFGLAQDSLLRNSFFLTASSGTQAAASFFFWVLASHLFSAGRVGTATTMLSGAVTISWISLFGFNSTFVRFLPTSRERDEEINTGLFLVFSAGVVAATLYVVIIPRLVPRLGLVQQSLGFAVGFVVLTALMGVNLVTDSVFVAFRKAQYNVLVDGVIQGGVKLVALALLVGLGAYGIFLSWGLAAAVAVVASIIYMMRAVGYRPKLQCSPRVLRRTWDYSAASYAANLLALGPPLVIPLVVLSVRGPRQAAFYYVAYQVANLLFALGWAVSTSLFAEGSSEGSDSARLLRRSARIVVLSCTPLGILVAVAGHWILLLFGSAYSAAGTAPLAILAASAPLVALYSLMTTSLRIAKKLRALVLTSAVFAVVIVGLALVLAGHGLPWVAAANVAGTAAAGLVAMRFASNARRGAEVTAV